MSRKNKSGAKIMTWTIKGKNSQTEKEFLDFETICIHRLTRDSVAEQVIILSCMYSIWGSQGTCGISTVTVTEWDSEVLLFCVRSIIVIYLIFKSSFSPSSFSIPNLCLKECVEMWIAECLMLKLFAGETILVHVLPFS